MLSQGAFNALLKTLEEPPAHVIFILATTEPQKVLPTIISRCQRYNFEKVSDNDLVNYIKNMPFHFTSSYGFDYSQVTIGGIKYDNLNNYQSKFENNVYFVGEVLDNDGLCGGYNLMYFISTAMELVDHL